MKSLIKRQVIGQVEKKWDPRQVAHLSSGRMISIESGRSMPLAPTGGDTWTENCPAAPSNCETNLRAAKLKFSGPKLLAI